MKIKICTLILLAGLPCGLLRADTLSYTVTSGVGAGQALYQFTFSNSGTTGGPVFDLFLALPTDLANINTAAIGAPVGWGGSCRRPVVFRARCEPFHLIY